MKRLSKKTVLSRLRHAIDWMDRFSDDPVGWIQKWKNVEHGSPAEMMWKSLNSRAVKALRQIEADLTQEGRKA